MSEKLFISPSILNEILARYSNLGCRFFPFSTLNISCHSLLACRVSAERSAVRCMRFPLYATCCFSQRANQTSLLVWLVCVLVCFSLGLSCLGLFVPLGLDWLFPFPCWEIFNYNLFKIFWHPFFFSSSSGTPIIWMLVHLILSQRSLRLSSVIFTLLFYSTVEKLFPPFYLPTQWFILLQILCFWFLLEYF